MRTTPALVAFVVTCAACSPASPGEQARRRPGRSAQTAPRSEDKKKEPSPTPSFTPSPTDLGQVGPRPWWKTRVDKLLKTLPFSLQVRYNGDVLYARDAHNDRVPASVEKLALSFALFEEFSPRATFPTRLAARRVKKGVIPGDLWVIGSGDPTLTGNPHVLSALPPGATDIQELVTALRHKGVREIRGNVMAATNTFARDWFAPGWRPYFPSSEVGLPSALTFNLNVHKGRYTKRPELALAESLRRRLRRSGIAVVGHAGAGPEPRKLRDLGRVPSPPLEILARYMNRQSSNFFAEVLGKRLGAETFGPPGTIRKGARAIRAYARQRGIEVETWDSSGLSYSNRMSAADLVSLIEQAETEPWVESLRRGLAGGGQGTLEDRLHDIRIRAKTGTLVDISALAGWVWLRKARDWAEFTIISRGLEKSRAMQIEDQIVRTLHNYAG